MAIAELEGIEEDEESLRTIVGDMDPVELEKILRRLGAKCCNKLFVEKMEERKNYDLPGVLRGYCRYCLGYKPLGECKGQGYNNPRMRNINLLIEIDRIKSEEVCF